MTEGRGRLSWWDQLPDWAEPVRVWAYDQLNDSKLTQLEILEEVNSRLRAAAWQEGITTDIPVASRSSLNRAAMRLAKMGRRNREMIEIATVLAPSLERAADDKVTLLVAQSIKTLVAEMLANAGEVKPDGDTAEMLMMASRALKHAEEAKKISTETGRKIREDLAVKAEKAIETVGKAQGSSPETIAALRQAIGQQIRERG